MEKRITIIGSGNVATHLALAFFKKGYIINQVFSKTEAHAKELAAKVNAEAVNSVEKLNSNFSVGIVAISDNTIKNFAKVLPFKDKIWLHTSGSTVLKVISSVAKNAGVIYPLQTFSKQKEINLSKVPFFIEASNEKSLNEIKKLATSISENVQVANSKTRKSLHIAAVFACNFTNHLYAVAANILNEQQLSFDLLKPLIAETVEKAMLLNPSDVQTGPAVRQDFNVLREHKKFLNYKKQYKRLYNNLSDSIILDKKTAQNKCKILKKF